MKSTPACSDRCDSGWITVLPKVADDMFPRPVSIDDPNLSDKDRTAVESHWRGQHAGALNTVYPCIECRPAAFHRWRKGHYASDHDQARCAECQDVLKLHQPAGERRQRPEGITSREPNADAYETKYRADLDG